MDSKQKKKVIVFSSLLVIFGVGGYLAWKYFKNKGGTDSSSNNGQTPNQTGGTGASSSGGGSGSGSSSLPTQSGGTQSGSSPIRSQGGTGLGTKMDWLDFQKYANDKGYTPPLVEDGIYGSKTKAAWSKLGTQYVMYKKGQRGS